MIKINQTPTTIKKSKVILAFLCLFGLLLWAQSGSSVSASTLNNTHHSSCTIPPSGPWPACATGGGGANSDCVIPPSGPWPPCATGGSSGGDGNGDCVIPPSGPWPACATGGSSGGGNGQNECVIPPSGPWPPCASGETSNQAPVIHSFKIATENPQPGETIRLAWETSNATQVSLRVGYDWRWVQYPEWRHQLFLSGSVEFTLPERGCFSNFVFELSAQNSAGDEDTSQAIVKYEPMSWVFDYQALGAPSDCPTSDSELAGLAEQQFENGLMIWSAARDKIYVLEKADNWNGYRVIIREDTYDPSVDAASDATLTPPEGMLQPTNGFGKVWRDNPHIREALGWATQPEQRHSGYIQGYSVGQRHSLQWGTFISGVDGFVWEVRGSMAQPSAEKTTVANP